MRFAQIGPIGQLALGSNRFEQTEKLHLTCNVLQSTVTCMKRHAVAVTDDEWNRAQRIGQQQDVPVSASAVLRAAIKIYLEQKEEELGAKFKNRTHKRV
jgi:hypothetical protein